MPPWPASPTPTKASAPASAVIAQPSRPGRGSGLADAEAKVRHLEEQLTSTPAQTAEHSGPRPADPIPQQLRAWARKNGATCNFHGAVARTVADAYHQACTAAA
ncbi:hypothetical protein [Kitasatospora sp. NPDC127116]|uniref:hypothetical protein n=1 Tax=Kitasatospora sp. NPDC127116 TaxID=3345367 RepID=UPI0036412DC0